MAWSRAAPMANTSCSSGSRLQRVLSPERDLIVGERSYKHGSGGVAPLDSTVCVNCEAAFTKAPALTIECADLTPSCDYIPPPPMCPPPLIIAPTTLR